MEYLMVCLLGQIAFAVSMSAFEQAAECARDRSMDPTMPDPDDVYRSVWAQTDWNLRAIYSFGKIHLEEDLFA